MTQKSGFAGSSPLALHTIEEFLGPVIQRCRSDSGSLLDRRRVAEKLGLDVDVAQWIASYPVDRDWIIGHLGSAMSAGQLNGMVCDALNRTLDRFDGQPSTEQVVTTALVTRRRQCG